MVALKHTFFCYFYMGKGTFAFNTNEAPLSFYSREGLFWSILLSFSVLDGLLRCFCEIGSDHLRRL